jgi:hypothetical protein
MPDLEESRALQSSSTTHLLPRKRKHRQLVLVDTDLRRSLRIKAFNTSFKASGCGKGDCLGCELDPPSISTRVIKNLGDKFCKMDPKELTEKALRAPHTTKRAIMKKQAPVAKQVSNKANEASKKACPNDGKKKNTRDGKKN